MSYWRGLLIHLDFLYYFKLSHKRRSSNLHSLFNEFYLTVLSIIFFVRGTARLRMNTLPLDNSRWYLLWHRNVTDLDFIECGMFSNRKSYIGSFLKEEEYFSTLFLSLLFLFSSVLYLKPWFVLLLLWRALWKTQNASLHRKLLHGRHLFPLLCFYLTRMWFSLPSVKLRVLWCNLLNFPLKMHVISLMCGSGLLRDRLTIHGQTIKETGLIEVLTQMLTA